jgi:predicted dehydrogenase
VTHHKTKVAVIGLGQWGRNHARIYAGLPNVHLAAVVDVNSADLRGFAHRYKAEAFTDYRKLLGRVDAVSVVVPTNLHFEVASAFLEADSHVLVEKPMTATTAEAATLVELARRKNRVLLVGHVERFKPAVRRLAELARKPMFIQARRVRPYDRTRTMDVGVVMDLMIHDIDIVLSLVRGRIVEVSGLAVRVHNSQEDLAVANLTLSTGCVAWLLASRVSADKAAEIEVTTPDRVIRLDYLKQRLAIHPFHGEVEDMAIHGDEPLLAELRHFINCVNGEEQPLVSGEDGLQALEVAHRLLQRMATVAPPVRV